MVRRVVLPSVAAFVVAGGVAWALDGSGAAVSAALGVAVVFCNFAVHGWSLAWASKVSVTAVHVVALVGPIVRIAVIVGLMFALETTGWFSVIAFATACLNVSGASKETSP